LYILSFTKIIFVYWIFITLEKHSNALQNVHMWLSERFCNWKPKCSEHGISIFDQIVFGFYILLQNVLFYKTFIVHSKVFLSNLVLKLNDELPTSAMYHQKTRQFIKSVSLHLLESRSNFIKNNTESCWHIIFQ
jgi:hypothetical protein